VIRHDKVLRRRHRTRRAAAIPRKTCKRIHNAGHSRDNEQDTKARVSSTPISY